jgi:hypothetical protein
VAAVPRGGARNRSGPSPDPDSGRSDRRGVVLTALPSTGYEGPIPEFPLPGVDGRELEVWREAWRTPQAAAWSVQMWRLRTVALWVRWSVRMEAADAGAALGAVVVRLADQIGMTPAGLRENGWRISEDETAKRRQQIRPAPAPGARRVSARDRLAVVADGTEG